MVGKFMDSSARMATRPLGRGALRTSCSKASNVCLCAIKKHRGRARPRAGSQLHLCLPVSPRMVIVSHHARRPQSFSSKLRGSALHQRNAAVHSSKKEDWWDMGVNSTESTALVPLNGDMNQDQVAEEFWELCEAQLALLEIILAAQTSVTVYLRSLESFEKRRLQLWRAWPRDDSQPDLAFNTSLQIRDQTISGGAPLTDAAAEAALMATDYVPLPNSCTLVVPIRRSGFLVGLLVAERETCEAFGGLDRTASIEGPVVGNDMYTDNEKSALQSVAVALSAGWALDQKSTLIEKSNDSQTNQLKRLVQQVSAPLTALRTLGFFMQDRIRPSDETSQDLVDNIVLQGDRLSEVAVQLQAALYPKQPMNLPSNPTPWSTSSLLGVSPPTLVSEPSSTPSMLPAAPGDAASDAQSALQGPVLRERPRWIRPDEDHTLEVESWKSLDSSVSNDDFSTHEAEGAYELDDFFVAGPELEPDEIEHVRAALKDWNPNLRAQSETHRNPDVVDFAGTEPRSVRAGASKSQYINQERAVNMRPRQGSFELDGPNTRDTGFKVRSRVDAQGNVTTVTAQEEALETLAAADTQQRSYPTPPLRSYSSSAPRASNTPIAVQSNTMQPPPAVSIPRRNRSDDPPLQLSGEAGPRERRRLPGQSPHTTRPGEEAGGADSANKDFDQDSDPESNQGHEDDEPSLEGNLARPAPSSTTSPTTSRTAESASRLQPSVGVSGSASPSGRPRSTLPLTCNVGDVAAALLSAAEGMAFTSNVKMTWEVETGRELPEAAVTPFALRKVLSTMLDSALMQASSGGSIHLTLASRPDIQASGEPARGSGCVEVLTRVQLAEKESSSSSGRPKRILARSETQSSWKVGLTIAMSQAAAMGGQLQVEVLPGNPVNYAAVDQNQGTCSIDWNGLVEMIKWMEGDAQGKNVVPLPQGAWTVVLRLRVPAVSSFSESAEENSILDSTNDVTVEDSRGSSTDTSIPRLRAKPHWPGV